MKLCWALIVFASVAPAVSAENFEKDVSRDVARVATLDLRVLAQPNADDYRVAYRIFEIAQQLDPENIELTRRLIEAAFAAGNQNAVIEQTRALIRLDPDDTVAQLRLISSRINQMQTVEERLSAYDRFLGETGAKLDAAIRSRLALDAAMLSRELGDVEAFADRLALAISLDQTNKEAASLALTFFADRVDDPIGRLELMSQLLLADPLDPNVHRRIALECAVHGAISGAARFHSYARVLTTTGGAELPEAMRLEWMCLGWQMDGPELILDQLQTQIDVERERARAMLNYMEEEGISAPDDFIPPDDIRLDSTMQTLRLYAADASGDAELRAKVLNDLAAEIRDQIEQLGDREQYPQLTDARRASIIFSSQYALFRAYAMFSERDDDVELLADNLRQLSDNADVITADLDAWLALRSGDTATALAYFEAAPRTEIVSLMGLASAYKASGRPTDAVRAYMDVHRASPLSPQGSWALDQIVRLAQDESAALWPWAQRMNLLAAQTPRWVEEMIVDTTSFMSLTAEMVAPTSPAIGPTPIRLTLRNLAPVSLGVGPDRPINSSIMLSPRTEVNIKTQLDLAQPEVVELSRRLRLRPREKLTVEIDPKIGFTGWFLETNSHATIRTRWRVVQGFLIGGRSNFEPGPMCLTTVAPQQLETRNQDALISVDELAVRIREAPRSMLRAAAIAVRTRLLVPESGGGELTLTDRAALGSACADRFAESDPTTKLLLLAALPHAGQAPEMGELDALARKDTDAYVLALTLVTRMPEVDPDLLERARSLDEPWLSDVAAVMEARVGAGVKGLAHATPALTSLGGYLRGSGSLESMEFDRPEDPVEPTPGDVLP